MLNGRRATANAFDALLNGRAAPLCRTLDPPSSRPMLDTVYRKSATAVWESGESAILRPKDHRPNISEAVPHSGELGDSATSR